MGEWPAAWVPRTTWGVITMSRVDLLFLIISAGDVVEPRNFAEPGTPLMALLSVLGSRSQ